MNYNKYSKPSFNLITMLQHAFLQNISRQFIIKATLKSLSSLLNVFITVDQQMFLKSKLLYCTCRNFVLAVPRYTTLVQLLYL